MHSCSCAVLLHSTLMYYVTARQLTSLCQSISLLQVLLSLLIFMKCSTDHLLISSIKCSSSDILVAGIGRSEFPFVLFPLEAIHALRNQLAVS